MSLALALVFIGYDLVWSGIHDEGPFDEILRAFGHAPAGSTSPPAPAGFSSASGLSTYSSPSGAPDWLRGLLDFFGA